MLSPAGEEIWPARSYYVDRSFCVFYGVLGLLTALALALALAEVGRRRDEPTASFKIKGKYMSISIF